MPSCCYGDYLVYIECSKICLDTMWCTLNASNSYFFSAKNISEKTQQRTATDAKLIITVLNLYMPADAK